MIANQLTLEEFFSAVSPLNDSVVVLLDVDRSRSGHLHVAYDYPSGWFTIPRDSVRDVVPLDIVDAANGIYLHKVLLNLKPERKRQLPGKAEALMAVHLIAVDAPRRAVSFSFTKDHGEDALVGSVHQAVLPRLDIFKAGDRIALGLRATNETVLSVQEAASGFCNCHPSYDHGNCPGGRECKGNCSPHTHWRCEKRCFRGV